MPTINATPLIRGKGLALKLAQLTSTMDHPFRYWLPYAFVPLKHPRLKHVFLPVNRGYKPLGNRSRKWIDYDKVLHSHAISFKTDPATFEDIWVGKPREGILYLYSDAPSSRVDYFERFGRLNLKPMKILR